MSKRYGLFAAVVLALSARAQPPQLANVNGRLQSATETILYGYLVELESVAGRGDSVRTDVEVGGDFSFRNIAFGDYLLKIQSFHGDAVAQQFLSVHERMTTVDVRLPPASPRPNGKTVSLKELQRPPARRAVDAWVSAQRLAESGRFDRAAGELEKAVRISPDFAVAHANLGVQYLRMHRFEEAHAEILRAIEIAGPNPRDLSNLAFAQAGLHRLPDAMESARAAIRLDRDNAPAHYVLGTLLALDRETRGEGIAHLEEAARTLESARQALAKLAK